MTKQNTKRAIPTVQEFYKTKKATDTYVAILLQSSLNTETKERYFDTANTVLSDIARQLGVARKTFYNHIETLTKGGFIRKDGSKYIFSKDHLYTLIEKETLKFLINTSNQYTIAVYAELSWRLNHSQEHNYPCQFTQKGLAISVGLTYNTTSNERIADILTMLHNNGLIEWKIFWKKEDGINKRFMVLTKVEKIVKQPIIEEVFVEKIEAPILPTTREKFVF